MKHQPVTGGNVWLWVVIGDFGWLRVVTVVTGDSKKKCSFFVTHRQTDRHFIIIYIIVIKIIIISITINNISNISIIIIIIT